MLHLTYSSAAFVAIACFAAGVLVAWAGRAWRDYQEWRAAVSDDVRDAY
jgi:hypothetical protein